MNSTSEAYGLSDALVLFGITGDLAKKKLFPAVYHMVKEGTPAARRSRRWRVLVELDRRSVA